MPPLSKGYSRRAGLSSVVSPKGDPAFDIHLPVADVGDASPIVNALPAQLRSYHLAKSVTVK